MPAGRIGCALALLAVLCVVTVFFFPAMEGPYSAVHGPVTALQSARAAAGLRLSLLEAGLNVLKGFSSSIVAIFLLFWTVASIPEFEPEYLACGNRSLLRC